MRRSVGLALAVAVLLVATAAGAAAADAAAGGASLRILSVLDDDVTDWIVADFSAHTGIRVERPLGKRSSLEAFTYFAERRGSPEVSVVLGGPGVAWAGAAANGLLERYDSPELAEFGPPADPEHRWFGFYRGTVAFVTRRESGISVPRVWSDLLRTDGPDLHVALANPATSGTALAVLTSLVTLMGEDAAFRYLAAVDRRVIEHPSAGAAVIHLVSEGIANVGIALDHDVAREMRRGEPLAISYPADGAAAEVGGVGILRDAPEPEAARRFVDRLLSREFQEALASSDVVLFEPLRDGVGSQRWRRDLPQPRRVLMEPSIAAAARERLLERWNREIVAVRAVEQPAPGMRVEPVVAHANLGTRTLDLELVLDLAAVALALVVYGLLRRRTTLVPRFLTLVLLAVLITALGIDRFAVRLERRASQEHREVQARTATELLAEESAVDLVARNVAAIAARVEKLFRYFPGELAEVEIVDASGARLMRAIWHGGGGGERVEWLERSGPQRDLAAVSSATSAPAATRLTTTFDPRRGREMLVVVAPMVAYDARRGEVRATFEPSASEPMSRTSTRNLLWVALAASVVGALAISLFVGREIVAPLDRLRERMVRATSGDLAVEMDRRDRVRRDEVAQVASAFGGLLAAFRNVVADTGVASAELEVAVAELERHVAELESRGERRRREGELETGEQAALSERLATLRRSLGELRRGLGDAQAFVEDGEHAFRHSAEILGRAADGTATAGAVFSELAAAAPRVDEGLQVMATRAREAGETIGVALNGFALLVDHSLALAETRGEAQGSLTRSRMLLHSTLHGLSSAAGTISEFVTLGRELGTRARQVGYLVKLIGEASEEIGVLALNAAILAAQAGPEGASFGVVADEMRVLAARAEQEALDADAILRAVERDVERAMTAAAEGQQSVGLAMGAANQMDASLDAVESRMTEAVGLVNAISASTEDQERGGRSLLEAVHEIEDRAERTFAESRRHVAALGELRVAVAAVAQAVRDAAETARREAERGGSARESIQRVGAHGLAAETVADEVVTLVGRSRDRAMLGASWAAEHHELARALSATAQRLARGSERLRAIVARFASRG